MHQNRSTIIKTVRAMLPARPLDMGEAQAVAETQALELLRLLGMTGPPVDIGLLTKLPRVRVEVVSDLARRKLSGESGWHRGQWLVRISQKDSLTRRRFTLAHEFKHILDAHAERRVYRQLGSDEEHRRRYIEEIADSFAAYLLMPHPFVLHALREDVRDLRHMAALFEVSPVAMNRRLRDLGLRIERPDSSPHAAHKWFRGMPARRLAESASHLRSRRVGAPSPTPEDAEPAESASPLGLVLTVPEACEALRISKWSLYRLIQMGKLASITIGRRRLIPVAAVEDLINRQSVEEAA